MKVRLTTVLLLVGGFLVCGCQAGESEPAVALEELSWIVGSWAGSAGDKQTEEIWIAARGGVMLGLHRDVPASGRAFFEYLRIESDAEGIAYLASPGGREATPFRLVESSERKAVFANPDHDFPKRIIYWREGDVLHARVEGEIEGEQRSSQWSWSRVIDR